MPATMRGMRGGSVPARVRLVSCLGQHVVHNNIYIVVWNKPNLELTLQYQPSTRNSTTSKTLLYLHGSAPLQGGYPSYFGYADDVSRHLWF